MGIVAGLGRGSDPRPGAHEEARGRRSGLDSQAEAVEKRLGCLHLNPSCAPAGRLPLRASCASPVKWE